MINVEEIAKQVNVPSPYVSAPVTKERSVSPGAAPQTFDLTSEYGPCKSSWFTQIYTELQAKKKLIVVQDKQLNELREENERLRTFNVGMPDFIERLEALINAQAFFKDAAKLHNSTPSSLMNKLEVFMSHTSIAEKQMQRKLDEQDSVIETLKEIITS